MSKIFGFLFSILLTVTSGIAQITGATLTGVRIQGDRTVYPTPDTQSAFIKSYNPRALIQRFACGNIEGQSTGGETGSAGIGFVHHGAGVTAYIEIDEDHWIPLMQALAADVKKQLLLGGSEGSGAGKGMTSRFYYQDGRTFRHGNYPTTPTL